MPTDRFWWVPGVLKSWTSNRPETDPLQPGNEFPSNLHESKRDTIIPRESVPQLSLRLHADSEVSASDSMPLKRQYNNAFAPMDTLSRTVLSEKTYGSNKRSRHSAVPYQYSAVERKQALTPQPQASGTQRRKPEEFPSDSAVIEKAVPDLPNSSALKRKKETMTTNGSPEHSQQTASITSLESFNRKGEKITPLGSKNEYAILESMMRPNSRHKKRPRTSNTNGNSISSFGNTSPISDNTHFYDRSYELHPTPIDLEDAPKMLDDRKGHRLSHPTRMAPLSKELQFVEDIEDSDSHRDANSHFHRQARIRYTQPRLRDSFKRDVGPSSDDTDELQQDEPSASYDRKRNSVHGFNRVNFNARKTQLSSDDIPPTKFYASDPTYSAGATPRPRTKDSPTRLPMFKTNSVKNAIPMTAFHSYEISISDAELCIARDRVNNGFIVFLGNRKQAEISGMHIRHVRIGESLERFRLLGPRGTIGPMIEYHLQFADAEAGGAFLHDLQSITGNSMTESQESDDTLMKMCSMFKLRRREVQTLQDRKAAEELRREQREEALSELQKARQAEANSTPRYSTTNPAPSRLPLDETDVVAPSRSRVKMNSLARHETRKNPLDFEGLVSDFGMPNTRSRQKTYRLEAKTQNGPSVDATNDENVVKYSISHGLGKPWKKPLVFPPNGPNKTTVEFSDLPRLDDGEFLNDNLISFWLRYSQKCHSELDRDVYFFNTYFYSSLTKSVKGKKGINYDLVERWTAKVDIFNYDYVVVPINENIHWYIAIICNLRNIKRHLEMEELDSKNCFEKEERSMSSDPPSEANGVDLDEPKNPSALGNTATSDHLAQQTSQLSIDPSGSTYPAVDPDEQKPLSPTSSKKRKSKRSHALRKLDPDEPVIITLDSFGIGHSPVVKNLKDYLRAEGNAKRGMDVEIRQNGVTAKGIPQQKNYYDCGLYVLFYLARFLQGPRDFITKILRRELDEVKDWPNLSSSDMRAAMRDTIQAEYQKQKTDHSESKRNSTVDASLSSQTTVMDALTGGKLQQNKNPVTSDTNLPHDSIEDLNQSTDKPSFHPLVDVENRQGDSITTGDEKLPLSTPSSPQPEVRHTKDAVYNIEDNEGVSVEESFMAQVAAAAIANTQSPEGPMTHRSSSPIDLEDEIEEERPPTRGKKS